MLEQVDFSSQEGALDQRACFAGLECLAGGSPLAFPLEAVDQIVQYSLAPAPPLAKPWFAGFGYFEDRVIVTLSVQPSRELRVITAVLLRGPRASARVAFEVTSALGIVRARLAVASPEPALLGLPSWVLGAETEDGRRIGWVDAERLLRDVLGQEALG